MKLQYSLVAINHNTRHLSSSPPQFSFVIRLSLQDGLWSSLIVLSNIADELSPWTAAISLVKVLLRQGVQGLIPNNEEEWSNYGVWLGEELAEMAIPILLVEFVDLGALLYLLNVYFAGDTPCGHCRLLVEGMDVKYGWWGVNQVGCFVPDGIELPEWCWHSSHPVRWKEVHQALNLCHIDSGKNMGMSQNELLPDTQLLTCSRSHSTHSYSSWISGQW